MQKRLRIFWGIILLLSILWILVGSVITSDAIDSGSVGIDLTDGIKSLASDINVEVPSEFPLPLAFIVSGLPLAAISLLFLWRSGKARSTSAVSAAGGNIRRQTILITILALVFALLLWNIRDVEQLVRQSDGTIVTQSESLSVSAITYPVRLFVTFVHEAGHSLAALLTGGEVSGFKLSPDGSGQAQVAGGSLALIAPAGYLGAALFGSLLFYVTNRIPKWTRGLSLLMGLAIIALSLSYALPDQAGNVTALITGIGFGVGLIALGWFAPRTINVFLLTTLAILTGLNAVFDLWLLVRNPGVGAGANDAARFSSEITPLLPTAVVAFLWAAIAVVMLLAAMYFGLIKQVGGEIGEVVKNKS